MRWRNRGHATAALGLTFVAGCALQWAAWNWLPGALALACVLAVFIAVVVVVRLITGTYRAHGWY